MLAGSMGNAYLASLACAACVLCACRVHTSRNSKATGECMRVAEDTGVLDHEQGKPPTDFPKVCGACCEKAGYSNVDPGSCSCGELGMDALWN